MIYEYECSVCKQRFDVSRLINERPDVKCPSCDGKANQIFNIRIRRYPIKNARARMNGKTIWEA